jgi:mitochondrial import receptor subunit TOM40
LQLSTEYSGSDYSCSIKTANPSLTEGTGVIMADYLQSLTPKLAVGCESIYQHAGPGMGEAMMSLVGRYQTEKGVFCANLQQMGVAQLSYHHKVNEKIELGTEIQLVTAGGRRDALTTIGGKFEFTQGCVRAQVDSTLRVAVLIEERLTPFLSFLVSGDLDHMKGQSKFGVGLMMEQ